MSDQIFIFLAGIALTTGIAYIFLGVVQKIYRTNFVFGLFAISSGVYYLLATSTSVTQELGLFFATAMFVLFPWYLAYESGYVKKNLLWLIAGLGLSYYIASLLILFFGIPEIQYLFSYSVYVLTAWYCIGCVKQIIRKKEVPLWPFLFVSIYYVVFVSEEIAFDQFGTLLPWRGYVNFTYLDLFPAIIIGMKFTILIYDQLLKVKLEKTVNIYKSNFDIIFNQTQKFVLSLDAEGKILFANPYFLEFFESKTAVIDQNIDRFLLGDSKSEFNRVVFDEESQRGSVISQLDTPTGILTVSWSFVKLKKHDTEEIYSYITLFGANITQLKETEEDLRDAYIDLEELKNKLQADNIQLRQTSSTKYTDDKLIGNSPNFNYVLNRIEDVASIEVPVLLQGETGVGKELFANSIHERSPRKGKPFIKVNCAAIPKDLIESELFGFERGAFTGADRLKKGMFELADGGTLFLDEIGDLPITLQPKLLRALQGGEIQRLGAEKILMVDVRIIAATNHSLEEEVEKGRFRSDLYYRLNVFPITIPPLRQRKPDISLLVKEFVHDFNKKYTKNINEISESLIEDLTNYSWPGNVRQLRNVIERALITSNGSLLRLAEPLLLTSNTQLQPELNNGKALLVTLEENERVHIINVLKHCKWKISGKNGAAEILDLPTSTLRSRMKKLGIDSQNSKP